MLRGRQTPPTIGIRGIRPSVITQFAELGGNVKLLQQPQHVCTAPAFGNFAIFKP